MSPLRQRKPAADVVEGDSPPELVVESDSSWEKSLDDSARNGDSDDNHDTDTNQTAEVQVIPAPKPSTLDKFLSTYGAFTSSTFTADQGFKILQWSSWAISYATQSTHMNLSPSLRNLYNELSMARYVLRFYGFLQSLEGHRSGSWAGGSWDNPLISKIAKYAMAGSMLAYYPLEHIAYAGWQMPKLVKVNANKISAISCIFWTTYIIGDFWVSCLKWKELKRKLGNAGEMLTGKKKDDDKEAITELVEEETSLLKKIRLIKLQLLRCLLFILPAINWSLPNWATNPLLDELPLNGLMLAEAYTSVYQSLISMCGC